MSEGLSDLTLSVIMVSYNVKDFLEQALISVQKALRDIPSEIIVVDNHSSDGSAAHLRARFPAVKLIENSENLGFAKASNQGLRVARGQFLALLNPDTIVQEDTFASMLAFTKEHPDTGMLGCKILNPNGTLQLACRRSFPTPWVAFTKLSGLSRLFPKSKWFGRYNLTFLDPDRSYEVEAVSGAIMMIPRSVLDRVGYLDETFFMYGEDLDWCYRIRENGWKVRYFSGTQIIHFKGESSKRAQFDRLKVFYQAMSKFAHKHFRAKYFFVPFWLLWLAIWARAGIAFLRNSLNYLGSPFADLVLLTLSLVTSVRLRFGDLADLGRFLPVFLAYSFIWMFLLNYFGCYHKNKFSSSKAALAVGLGFFINAALTFFFKQYAFSRAMVLIAGMLCLIIVPGWRLLVRILPRLGLMPFRGTLGKTLLARNALIVGDQQSGEKLFKKFNSQIDSGYNIAGLITLNGKSTDGISDITVLGSLQDLHTVIKERNIQEVIFSTSQLSYDRILGIMSQSGKQRVNFKLVPSTLEVIIGKASIDRIDDMPLLELDYKLHQPHNQILKRGFDVTLAVLLGAMAAPVFLFKKYLTGAKLQKKIIIGNFNRKFTLYKFANDHSGIIDKIPYLWSVLKGDVSFVGSELVEGGSGPVAKNQIELKPGITGLAQVNRHKPLTSEDQDKYHLYYLKNYSPLLDLEILLKAIFKI